MASKSAIEVDGRRLEISNLDKVLYPATGFTKGQVLDYYARIAPVILDHLEGRPVTMRRFPDGVEAPSFFAKHLPKGAPKWLRTYHVPGGGRAVSGSLARDSELIEFVGVEDSASLMWVANLAALELHVPQWKVGPDGDPLPPDLLVLDLDPGPPAAIAECCRVALVAREALLADGLTAYPKTSGSKGLQLYAAVEAGGAGATVGDYSDPGYEVGTWSYARQLAERLEAEHRGEIVSNMKKSLRAGKVLIDWSQNSPAKTTVAPYSLRARPEPTVSTPVTWDEVEAVAETGDGSGLVFLSGDVLSRVEEMGDLFAPLST